MISAEEQELDFLRFSMIPSYINTILKRKHNTVDKLYSNKTC